MSRVGFHGKDQSEARKTGLDRVINARLKRALDSFQPAFFLGAPGPCLFTVNNIQNREKECLK